MSRTVRRILMAAISCPLLAGCAGYHVGAIKPTFMQGINTIDVPTFRNETLIPRIEVLATDTVIRQIQEDGTYKVASSSDKADAVLEAEITNITRRSERSVLGDVQATQEFEMTIGIHYRVVRKATGEVVEDKSVTGTTDFFVSADVNQDERQAIPLAMGHAAVRIVSDLSEGW